MNRSKPNWFRDPREAGFNWELPILPKPVSKCARMSRCLGASQVSHFNHSDWGERNHFGEMNYCLIEEQIEADASKLTAPSQN